MNLFYTGVGIARSLGERGVSVIGLTARPDIYGNWTRYAKAVLSPDSRDQPEALAEFLVKMGRELDARAVLFPTRDDDLVFLNRFRPELEPYFSLVAPPEGVLARCLDKWETYRAAVDAGVPTPKSWVVSSPIELASVAREVTYPCVLKPISAYQWRRGGNWALVGSRKAVCAQSEDELRAEYHTVAQAESRVLVQEAIQGGDDGFVIAACYWNRQGEWVAGFNTRKLLQVPTGFGTGCIVESADRPEVFEPTRKLLGKMGYSGIAEVEYKWDVSRGEFMLIEINPRPWDQHRLGTACGVDLVYLAYCDHAGRPVPQIKDRTYGHKWIAEDTFLTTALRLLWKREPGMANMFRLARGSRIYAIWSRKDPLPFVFCMFQVVKQLVGAGMRRLGLAIRGLFSGSGLSRGEAVRSEGSHRNANSKIY